MLENVSSKKILDVDRLNFEILQRLVCREIIAIRVRSFFSELSCQRFCEIVEDSSLKGRYVNAPDINRIGQAFFESQASEAMRSEYAENALDWVKLMRTECAPLLTPIDKLRLELDEAWRAGSMLGTLFGRKMFAGLVRVFNAGSEAEPHVDVLSGISKARVFQKIRD